MEIKKIELMYSLTCGVASFAGIAAMRHWPPESATLTSLQLRLLACVFLIGAGASFAASVCHWWRAFIFFSSIGAGAGLFLGLYARVLPPLAESRLSADFFADIFAYGFCYAAVAIFGVLAGRVALALTRRIGAILGRSVRDD